MSEFYHLHSGWEECQADANKPFTGLRDFLDGSNDSHPVPSLIACCHCTSVTAMSAREQGADSPAVECSEVIGAAAAATAAAAAVQQIRDQETKTLSAWNKFEVCVPISAYADGTQVRYRSRYVLCCCL